MIKIYHNPRCTKSRQGIAFLEENEIKFEVVKYLENNPSKEELKHILKLLGFSPIELVRKNEAIWKEQFKGKDLSDEAIIDAMLANPKLIERPIISNGTKAVIGRPTENIKSILN